MEKMAISYAKYARYASGVAAPLGFTVALCTQTCAAGGAVGPVVGGLAILEGEE